jgi:hypothetical protein
MQDGKIKHGLEYYKLGEQSNTNLPKVRQIDVSEQVY